MRYIVICFYEHLGIDHRRVDFNSLNKAYAFVGGCRMSETPYLLFDSKEHKVMEYCCYDMPKEKMIKIVEESL